MSENIYRINPDSGQSVIDIALDDYMDFFHEWDNSILKKRDMHPELAEFLDLCSEDIPLKQIFEINFFIEKAERDPSKEALLKDSYKNYYKIYCSIEKKKIIRLFKTTALLSIISLFFISLNFVLIDILPKSIFAEVLLEGLLVGGWVFLWEAIHYLSFERRDYFHRYRELKRFLITPISFGYKKS
ncbi:MAG: hypothetical protein JW908_10790 [Anaerolineales bacterium]|nr:hypothetical protein [Anaerolineales bacterium]